MKKDPIIIRNIFLWFKKKFGVLTIDECKNLQLTFCHNIYGDSINHFNCRSIWRNNKGKSYRCQSLYELLKQESQQDSRHNMRMMYEQAMHDKKNEMNERKLLPKDENRWIALKDARPDENETVWLYNNVSRFLALGCRAWVGGDSKESGWLWSLSNGTIYSENRKIVSEGEAYDDYEFTHWCPLPTLPL